MVVRRAIVVCHGAYLVLVACSGVRCGRGYCLLDEEAFFSGEGRGFANGYDRGVARAWVVS